MLIFKSFYRKKSTKIYLAIITLIFTAVLAVFTLRNYNMNQANYNFRKSYLMFEANKEELENIKNIKGIKKVTPCVKATILYTKLSDETNTNTENLMLIENNSLKIGQGIGNYELQYIFDFYTSQIYLNNTRLEFTINNFLEEEKEINYKYLHISPTDFKNYASQVDKYTYIVNLEKWFNKGKVEKELQKEILTISNIEEYDYNVRILDYSLLNCLIFTILLVILSIIFMIVLIVNIKNILIDENKNTKLYICLGFHKSTIKKYHFLEIFSLILLSLIIGNTIVSIVTLLL